MKTCNCGMINGGCRILSGQDRVPLVTEVAPLDQSGTTPFGNAFYDKPCFHQDNSTTFKFVNTYLEPELWT